MSSTRKYIVVTGGVISGLGKGVTAASLGFFFSDQYKVIPIKLDGYLNSDPGTMNPFEHGEVFVLDDGFEVDMDFGHYERFLASSASKDQSITMGKIFKEVRMRERKGQYLGKTVQLVPHVTDLIQEKILEVSEKEKGDIVLIEVGGTIGDMENELYIEALRQLEKKVGHENMVFIHLTYVPIPFGVKEQKTKPTQQSISLLHNKGIWPAIVIGRCSEFLSENSREKIALFSNISKNKIFTAPDLNCIYELPDVFAKQGVIEHLCEEIDVKAPDEKKLKLWNELLQKKKEHKIIVTIAGKYTDLEDSYASILESLNHCSFNLGAEVEVEWLETTNGIDKKKLAASDAIIVPGGFGSRGVDGKIEVIRYARENKIPYLGICYGLQLAIVEYARNVCGIKDAHTVEVDPDTRSPVITLLDEQKNVVRMGGTMRLGSYNAVLRDGQIKDLYESLGLGEEKDEGYLVKERHRHRYEVNPEYVELLKKNKVVISGFSEERELVEFIELPKEVHPYFVATQSHPELKSRLESPAPLFYGLVQAAILRNSPSSSSQEHKDRRLLGQEVSR